ncbi:LamG domain-containing protein [Colwellia sp. MB02u-18]|uniref:LamG domain-containing protein n=1 Tax=unclassified Colwellia TaxID=196834 RepID=UPI0015F636FC|nr:MULTISPECIES: LamG domain-containing protein [unclassified Colwellia]MBA6223734.1 LamG domain-containing protein [Colwellia sp. MB3u-45]MBA6268464.1 LamG domain-containing protein [Colwellia sp. MB3u-43]MBA6319915.1 LamG domain-containing protein [Colwellia sp. MB02u-19]MBA6324541.1 LamG domain-containing protein [Colwellia sp. MB02u-18]MBA6330696.1 LamG domain-containing protein [Colwellia sp. MB02u-12]
MKYFVFLFVCLFSFSTSAFEDTVTDNVEVTLLGSASTIAHYKFDETDYVGVKGEVIDETGNFSAQAVNGATTGKGSPALMGNPGTCGYAAFDGSDDYIELPSSFEDLHNSFTITAWIHPENVNSGSRIFIDDENNQQGFGFSLGDAGNGQLRFFSRGVNPVSVDTTASITPNRWTFVAAVHNSLTKTRQIYINGVAQTLNGVTTISAYTGTWGTDTGPASIGGETKSSAEGGDSFHFTGKIDEAHVFKGALTETEIEQLYNQKHACAEPAIDHYEIVHDGNGLTCAAEPITIKACTNSDCTTVSTESVNVDFTITTPEGNKEKKASLEFTGSSSFKFKHVTAETIVLSIDTSNAVECSGVDTGCEMTFSDTGFRFLYGDSNSEIISAQTAGKEFGETVKLHAVKSENGVCEGLFSGDVKVSLAQQNITPNLDFNAGLAFQTKGITIAKHPQFTDDVILNFASDSMAIIPTPNYFDAGEIRLHAKFSNSNITIVGSSNNFWVKPHHFALTATNSNGALVGDSAASSIKHKAGKNFKFTVSALNFVGDLTQNYRQADGRLQLKVSRVAPSLNGAIDGSFTYAAEQSITATPLAQDVTLTSFNDGVKGQSDFNGAQYDEVGIIKSYVQDINYGGLGNKNGRVEATGIEVGRFTPAYFKQTVKEEHKGDFDAAPYYPDERAACSISNWAYTGQRTTDDKGVISYNIDFEPKIKITAFNANNAITQNYTLGEPEGFMKLLASSVDISLPSYDKEQQVVDSTSGDHEPVAISAVMHTGNLTASPDKAGELFYTFSPNDHFTYLRDGSSLLPPFTAKIPFVTEQVNDTDGIKLAINISTNKVAESATETFVTDGVEIRFARMVLQNSYGSENAKLRSQLTIEVYDEDKSFNTHSDESCLMPLIGSEEDGAKYSGNMKLWDYRLIDIDGDSDDIEVSNTEASVSGDFYNGIQSQLFFSKPTEQGTLEWEYQVPSWLAFNWDTLDANNDGNFYDDNPSATLSFGIYRGNDRIISWYEVLN